MSATGIGASSTAQGRPALHHRQGPVHRRHQPPRPDLRRVRALAARPRQHQAHRHRRGDEIARLPRRLHRRRHRRRQGRRPDLRLDDPLQGRLAHEGRRASGAGPGQGALRRRPRRRRHRRDAGAGQGCRRAASPSTTTRCRPPSMSPPRRTPASRRSTPKRPTTPSTSGTSATRRPSMPPSPTPSTSPRSISSTTG